jgi:hypothetical protein
MDSQFDFWAHCWYTTTWTMENFPPIQDYHHFEILNQKEKEYQEMLEFYGDNEYYDEENDYYNELEEIDSIYNNNYEDYLSSSSDSENDDYEYI